MNLFRIVLERNNPWATITEDRPFATFEEAEKYAHDAMLAAEFEKNKVSNLGEACLMKVEVTDTYGGEANYSWVKRYEEWVVKWTADREFVRRAKALAGWTGHPCTTENLGSGFTIWPRGLLQVMFINFDYE